MPTEKIVNLTPFISTDNLLPYEEKVISTKDPRIMGFIAVYNTNKNNNIAIYSVLLIFSSFILISLLLIIQRYFNGTINCSKGLMTFVMITLMFFFIMVAIFVEKIIVNIMRRYSSDLHKLEDC